MCSPIVKVWICQIYFGMHWICHKYILEYVESVINILRWYIEYATNIFWKSLNVPRIYCGIYKISLAFVSWWPSIFLEYAQYILLWISDIVGICQYPIEISIRYRWHMFHGDLRYSWNVPNTYYCGYQILKVYANIPSRYPVDIHAMCVCRLGLLKQLAILPLDWTDSHCC